MRVLNLVVVAVALLTGCGVQVVSTSPRTVVVQGGTAYTQEAQRLADKECAKNGRFARMSSQASATSSNYVFDCVN